MQNGSRLILDLGSHSAKIYRHDSSVNLLGVVTWELLELSENWEVLERTIRTLLGFRIPSDETIHAVGTEAMRRFPMLAARVAEICRYFGAEYRTLSQADEASLIYRAIQEEGEFSQLDILNVGGGSIQIYSPGGKPSTLLRFGISDLIGRFKLNSDPSARRTEECVAYVKGELPSTLSRFAYTGGELTYLRAFGVPLHDGKCAAKDFLDFADAIAKMPLERLVGQSPYDPKWMKGAVASNCIVRAALEKSLSNDFKPTDFNIAHGWVKVL